MDEEENRDTPRTENEKDRRQLRERESREAFDVDGMLGRLAKWLRILGFDAEYPVVRPRAGRVFLTRKKSCASAIRVSSDDPLEQMKQVFEEVGVKPDPDLFLSRCLVCNEAVRAIGPDQVRDRVPPGVLAMTERFNECPRCGRIYWEGTHHARIKMRLDGAGIEMASPGGDA